MKKLFFCLSVVLLLTGCSSTNTDTIHVSTSALIQKNDEIADTLSLEVHFIDAGQSDATLIKYGESAVLIDSGDDSKGTAIQLYLTKQGVKRLDYLILTHPDADHIGGAPVIITKFDIDTVFMSNFEKDNKTYRKVIQALDEKRLSFTTPAAGHVYSLISSTADDDNIQTEASAEFTIIAPVTTYHDPNNSSIGLILTYGETRFIFTGDAEEKAENDILDTRIDLSANVYSAGHHGSKTASSPDFLDAIKPEYAVISCGEDNSYGFPHAEVLNHLRSRGIQVFRTDEQGSLIAVSNGKEITWNSAPSTTWQAGEPTRSSITESNEHSNTGQTKEPVIKAPQDSTSLSYILNIKSKKFHTPSCLSLPNANREDSNLSRAEIISQGYEPCKNCNP